jgi:uncharacterized protein
MNRSVLAAALLLGVVASAAGGPPPASPHAKVHPVGLADAKWTTGFWAERFETCRAATVPAMGDVMEDTERSQFLHNFRIAGGLAEGKHRGPPWNDGDLYKWLEAASAVYAVAKDPALDKRMDDAIAVIAKAQRADGYVHTSVLIANRNGDSAAKPFQDRLNFEMYNFGHLFTAAAVHHRATGKKTLLAVAVKAADFLAVYFQSPTPELAKNAVCPSHYMGVIDLYRATGDPNHLALACKLFAMRDLVRDGTDDNQDRIPFRKQRAAVGHAVRATYLYAGAADLYAETGDKTLLPPLEAIWEDVTKKKLYVTGGCGALYDGASPDGSKDQSQIGRTHQSFGRDYQLPNATAHNETCAAVGFVLWNERMLAVTGEPKYADAVELALYNAVLAGVSLDGTKFFYTNTLRQLDRMPVPLRWSRSREAWISCYCCPPNVARTIARVNGTAYGRSAGTLWVHLYGGSTLDTTLPNGGRVKLNQTTTYPWDGTVTFAVEAVPKGEIGIRFRVPAWAERATLAVNKEPWPVRPVAGRYAEVRRVWAAGDTVELVLPLKVRLLESHPLIEETRNHVAVRRGPVVYCLESPDLPKGAAVLDVAIPRDITLKPVADPKVLGGATLLEGTAARSGDRPWDRELYRELGPDPTRPLPIRLVPYYAWGNRGPSEMSVWLPLKP